MTSVCLTNQDRENVASAAITGAFAARKVALAQQADVLARRCYDAVFSAAVRKQANAMPDGWLSKDSCLRFNVGGMDIRLSVIGEGLPVPVRSSGYCERLGAISDPDLVQAVTSYLAEDEALKTERSKAKASLKGLLYSVSTLKALRELWPEGEPYLTGLAGKPGAPGLPAPQIAESGVRRFRLVGGRIEA